MLLEYHLNRNLSNFVKVGLHGFLSTTHLTKRTHHYYTSTFYFTGEHFGDAFGEINPFRKVPVIDDDGFKLTERYSNNYHLV